MFALTLVAFIISLSALLCLTGFIFTFGWGNSHFLSIVFNKDYIIGIAVPLLFVECLKSGVANSRISRDSGPTISQNSLIKHRFFRDLISLAEGVSVMNM